MEILWYKATEAMLDLESLRVTRGLNEAAQSNESRSPDVMKMLLFFSSWFVFAILSVGILVRPAYGFNNDEYADIVWHNKGTGENLAWFMNQTNYVSSGSFTTTWSGLAHCRDSRLYRDSNCDLLGQTTGANTICSCRHEPDVTDWHPGGDPNRMSWAMTRR
jgi:hypothetical protein